MEDYINKKIHGLPKPLKKGANTSPNKESRMKEYVHEVQIRGYTYFKVQIKRQGVSKIKYFKTFTQANDFVEMLKANPYF